MRVYLLVDDDEILGCYESLSLALAEEEDEGQVISLEVVQEEREPQRMMVIYEDWGPSMPVDLRRN